LPRKLLPMIVGAAMVLLIERRARRNRTRPSSALVLQRSTTVTLAVDQGIEQLRWRKIDG
jgi:hypothetical protein